MAHKVCFVRIAVVEYSADLAHLVERDLAKVEVAGSSPVIRSTLHKRKSIVLF